MAEEIKPAEIVAVKDEQCEELLEAGQASSEEITFESFINNSSKGSLKLIEMHFWKGRSVTYYDEIQVNQQGRTLQRGTRSEGVKFGLVYTDGVDADAADARKFVVAIDSLTNKIYAETGPIGPIDWNVVEVKLGMAEDKVVYEDPILGGKVEGQMHHIMAFVTVYN
ncbi:uncharacterized protein LOC141609290 [Silene latifolia]|uniref:uncharacterized protein LOC141609290 n=1 Tax=Silene latifolia TaxID=37657 RepID=UPI003D76C05D